MTGDLRVISLEGNEKNSRSFNVFLLCSCRSGEVSVYRVVRDLRTTLISQKRLGIGDSHDFFLLSQKKL
jgi:hypothetical protein